MKKALAILCILPAFLLSVEGSENCDCRKVDGGLTEWTRFSPCSVSCGTGAQKRVRYCTNPYPQYGGNECTGNQTETKSCKIKECPVNGEWSDFVASGTCSKSCGGGQQTFNRSCTNPSPAQCGKQCEGSSTKVEECNTHSCPEWKEPYKCGDCKKSANGKCQKVCQQQCHYRDVVVEDSYCAGTAPTNTEDCSPGVCLDHTTACESCHQKALAEAAKFGSDYWKNNWVGHACRDSEVSTDLTTICEHVTNKSQNGGINSNKWFWIHCSPDGPWCKPCATRNLVFNQKCDACEATADGPCSK